MQTFNQLETAAVLDRAMLDAILKRGACELFVVSDEDFESNKHPDLHALDIGSPCKRVAIVNKLRWDIHYKWGTPEGPKWSTIDEHEFVVKLVLYSQAIECTRGTPYNAICTLSIEVPLWAYDPEQAQTLQRRCDETGKENLWTTEGGTGGQMGNWDYLGPSDAYIIKQKAVHFQLDN